MSKQKVYWPSWRYHESCPEGQVFQAEIDVPEGWVDHPSKLGNAKPAPVSAPVAAPAKRASKADQAEAERQKYLAAAHATFGEVAVPANATLEELIEGLGGEAAALEAVKALNGNRR